MYQNRYLQSDENEKSFKVLAGSRTFFFNVKTDSKGTKYLKISEKRKNENGQESRNNIFVYEEDITKFAEAFNQALVEFGTNE